MFFSAGCMDRADVKALEMHKYKGMEMALVSRTLSWGGRGSFSK